VLLLIFIFLFLSFFVIVSAALSSSSSSSSCIFVCIIIMYICMYLLPRRYADSAEYHSHPSLSLSSPENRRLGTTDALLSLHSHPIICRSHLTTSSKTALQRSAINAAPAIGGCWPTTDMRVPKPKLSWTSTSSLGYDVDDVRSSSRARCRYVCMYICIHSR